MPSRPGSTCSARTASRRAWPRSASCPGARWHLVGPLQSNKARRALEAFDSIQTVDSVDLARRLDRLVPEVAAGPALPGAHPGQRRPRPGQVGLPAGRGRGGDRRARRAAAPRDPRADDRRPARRLGRRGTRPRSAACASCRSGCAASRGGSVPDLSMGMTDDFELAVEEGATIVRVGRAIFGEREHDHDHHARGGRLSAVGGGVVAGRFAVGW